MSKKLEEYIRTNKKAFDAEFPSDELWRKIESGLDKEKIKRPLRMMPLWLGIAASLTLMMAITFMAAHYNRHKDADTRDVNSGYAQKEMKFAGLIEEKRDSLEVYAAKNPVLYNQFNTDFKKLGDDYERLKGELRNSPNQKLVISAMVKNLELQLQVINQQLSIINEVNTYKKEHQI